MIFLRIAWGLKCRGLLATAQGYARRPQQDKATYLAEDVLEQIKLFPGKKIGLLLFKNGVEELAIDSQEIFSEKGDLQAAAKGLYAALHRLDKLQLDLIIAERFPDAGLGKTINDRLKRAVEK